MTMYEKEDARAAAVQAAASILGKNGYYRRDKPGGGYEYLPSWGLIELTRLITGYVRGGSWEAPSAGG